VGGPEAEPTTGALLHLRASDWFGSHGSAEEAVRHALAAGDFQGAAYLMEDADYLREYEHLTLARLLLAQHHAEQSRDHAGAAAPPVGVLGLLDRLRAAATDAGRDGSVLEIRVLQALTHQAHGDQPAALAALGRALGEAPEPESYVRLYLDEGARMMALLNQFANAPDPIAGAGRGEKVRGRARRLLERARAVQRAEPPQPPVEPLSQRELDVLRLLDSELTGPEIARELYVTLNSLRTPHEAHLHQARRQDAGSRRTPRSGARTDLVPVATSCCGVTRLLECHHINHIMW
jgi:LuxR family maltose regulon positive regulatory protein